MKIKEGYIYIMQLSDRDDIVKIGFTENHPHVRAKELSKREAAISTFIPYFYLKVSDAVAAERLAHKLFDNIRIDSKKEFFKSEDAEGLEKMIIKLIFNFGQNKGLIEDKDSEAVYWKGKSLISFEQAYKIATNPQTSSLKSKIEAYELALEFANEKEAETLKIKIAELQKLERIEEIKIASRLRLARLRILLDNKNDIKD